MESISILCFCLYNIIKYRIYGLAGVDMSEDSLKDMELLNHYKYLIENLRDTIWEVDINLICTYVSPNVRDIIGYEAEEIVGRCMLDFLSCSSGEELSGQWKRKLKERVMGVSKAIVFLDAEFVSKDERKVWLEASGKPVYIGTEFVGYIVTTRDISERKTYGKKLGQYIKELRQANSELEKMTNYDVLTGSYNRRQFEHFIRTSMDMRIKYNCNFSIILFDIDHFKQINDQCGHGAGDRLLKEIGEIVRKTLRETDKLFRWGGDSFIILLPGIALKDACKVAEKVRGLIETENFRVNWDKVTLSLGVGEYALGQSMEQFVSDVDKAMLRAKTNGKNRVESSIFCDSNQ